MLPAFRIRNLNRSPAPPSRPVGSSPRKAASLDAVVRITSPEYDETVDRHPEASLKYLDDDDGEIVTVGSSLELRDRLKEPISKALPTSIGAESNPDRPWRDVVLRPSSPSSEVHTFEIDRRGDSVKIWREIEQRNKLPEALCPPNSSDALDNDAPDSLQHDRLHSVRSPFTLRIPRERGDVRSPYHFPTEESIHSSGSVDPRETFNRNMLHQQQAQQPAQRPYLNQDATENERRFQGIRKDTRDTTLEAVAASPAVGEDMTITTEGKRQAQAAGAKLRARSRQPNMQSIASSEGENRWASYNQSRPESSSTQYQPLLQAFKEELAKLPKDINEPTKLRNNGEKLTSAADSTSHTLPETSGLETANASSNMDPGDVMIQTIKSLIEGYKSITSEFRNETPESQNNGELPPAQVSAVIESGLRNVFRGFEQCVQTVARSFEEVSVAARNAAYKTRTMEVQGLEAVINRLQNVGENTGLGGNQRSTADSNLPANFSSAPWNQPAEFILVITELPDQATPADVKELVQKISNMNCIGITQKRVTSIGLPPAAFCQIHGEDEAWTVYRRMSKSSWAGNSLRVALYSYHMYEGAHLHAKNSTEKSPASLAIRVAAFANPKLRNDHVWADYQMQLELLEEQNKKRLLLARKETDRLASHSSQPTSVSTYQSGAIPSVSRQISPDCPIQAKPVEQAQPRGAALQDYQMQLMLLEQQHKKKLLLAARTENDRHTSHSPHLPLIPNRHSSGSLSNTVYTVTDCQNQTERSQPGSEEIKTVGNQSSTVAESCNALKPDLNLGSTSYRLDSNGLLWFTFSYSYDGCNVEYTIRGDTGSVNLASLSPEFKGENSVHYTPSRDAMANRTWVKERNEIGWALAELNPCLRGKGDLIEEAVKVWWNSPFGKAESSSHPRDSFGSASRPSLVSGNSRTMMPASNQSPNVVSPPNPRRRRVALKVEQLLREGQDKARSKVQSTASDVLSAMPHSPAADSPVVKTEACNDMGSEFSLHTKAVPQLPNNVHQKAERTEGSPNLPQSDVSSCRPEPTNSSLPTEPIYEIRIPRHSQSTNDLNKHLPTNNKHFPPLPTMEPLIPSVRGSYKSEKPIQDRNLASHAVASQSQPSMQPLRGNAWTEENKRLFSTEVKRIFAHYSVPVSYYVASKIRHKLDQTYDFEELRKLLESKGISNKNGIFMAQEILVAYNDSCPKISAMRDSPWNPILIAPADLDSDIQSNNSQQSFKKSDASEESSGEFFKRMTGRGEPWTERPSRPASVFGTSVPPTARLPGPFDPLADETASAFPRHLKHGVRRSATSAGLNDRFTASTRRPYSEAFSGNGRMEWDSFLSGQHEMPKKELRKEPLSLRTGSGVVHKGKGRVRWDNGESKPEAPDSSTQTQSWSGTKDYGFPSPSEATAPLDSIPCVDPVKDCVKQLHDLGFRGDDDYEQRLSVYASATKGDLGDAIDLLEEEAKAWEERTLTRRGTK